MEEIEGRGRKGRNKLGGEGGWTKSKKGRRGCRREKESGKSREEG